MIADCKYSNSIDETRNHKFSIVWEKRRCRCRMLFTPADLSAHVWGSEKGQGNNPSLLLVRAASFRCPGRYL